MSMMTEDQAREFRILHDHRTRTLSRMTKAALVAIRAGRLRDEGVIWISGGPSSKDELMRDLLERDYPVARLNEAIHVLYHKPGENWSACEHCHPHDGAVCECNLRPHPGDTRTCPDCGRPQHYTGTENDWCHDALIDTWDCADPRKDSHPPEPVAADQARRIQTAAPATHCQYCRKRIHRQRNGAWYHDHNASASCRPGEGSDRRALPAGA